MRYLIAAAGGLILLLGSAFAAIDVFGSDPVSSLSIYGIGLGAFLVLGGLYVEVGRAASAIERWLAENEKRRLAEKQASEETRSQLEAEIRLAATQEEKRKKEQALAERWNDLRDLEPQRPIDISQHRAMAVAGNIRMWAWLILLSCLVAGALSVSSRQTEMYVGVAPVGVLLCLALRGLASVVELLAESCVLLGRLDDRMQRLDDREALKIRVAVTATPTSAVKK